MLEQVGSLFVDLEGIVLMQQVEVEQVGHTTHCNTNGYVGSVTCRGLGGRVISTVIHPPPLAVARHPEATEWAIVVSGARGFDAPRLTFVANSAWAMEHLLQRAMPGDGHSARLIGVEVRHRLGE